MAYAAATKSSRIKKYPDGVVHYTHEVIDGGDDEDVAITEVTTMVILNSTTGAKAITTTSAHEGQRVLLVAEAVSGGSYTLDVADIAGGADELTFDAVAEVAEIVRISGLWYVVGLRGATIV